MNEIKKIKVHFMPGDGKGWALDEDLRQMRTALKDVVCETTLACAEVIHTPFWQGLSEVAPEILEKAFVIAHADNPPFFYLKQPEFLLGQKRVDLWVARSQQALEQFRVLRLPVTLIPYTIDPELFFPISDKKALRGKFGIPDDSYVIANFHRDTEGADLVTPKLQKAPELMLAILKKLQTRGEKIHVLLAGPRRNWLRAALTRENIPYTFVGKKEITGDDFGINILDRATLNELTNAADLYLIPSRWEGGPQSAMEAAACRCKILSTPLGVARDILEPTSLFHSAGEASDRICDDIKNNSLQSTLQPQWERWKASHTTVTMERGLRELYATLPSILVFQKKLAAKKMLVLSANWKQAMHILKTRLGKKTLPKKIGWNHQPGKNSDLDALMLSIGQALKALKIELGRATSSRINFIGWPTKELSVATSDAICVQWIVPRMPAEALLPEAFKVMPSVQDVINLRKQGFLEPATVVPFPPAEGKKSEEPLVVDEDDHQASIKIWRAMAAGRPIVYPENTAYYEQVFHGGLSYQHQKELPRVLALACKAAREFSSLVPPMTMRSATKALEQLLMELVFYYDQF